MKKRKTKRSMDPRWFSESRRKFLATSLRWAALLSTLAVNLKILFWPSEPPAPSASLVKVRKNYVLTGESGSYHLIGGTATLRVTASGNLTV